MFSKLFKKDTDKWKKSFSGDFIEVKKPLNHGDIKEILLVDNLDRIQLMPPLEGFDETWKLLNDYFFKEKPGIELRIYGNRELFKDLSFLQYLPNLKRFAIDEWYLKDLSPLLYLKDLVALSVGETKTTKLSYSPIGQLKNLKELYINGTKKDMEALADLKKLERLTLRSVNLDSLEILTSLDNLKELYITLGGIRNFDLLPQIGKLEKLELCWIKELPQENLQPITNMPYLKHLILDRLPHVYSVEWLKNAKSLRNLELIELKNLESLKGIEEIASLEELTVGTKTKDKNIEPILHTKNLKKLFIPYIWGKDNLLKMHQRHPHLEIDKYLEEFEERLRKIKES